MNLFNILFFIIASIIVCVWFFSFGIIVWGIIIKKPINKYFKLLWKSYLAAFVCFTFAFANSDYEASDIKDDNSEVIANQQVETNNQETENPTVESDGFDVLKTLNLTDDQIASAKEIMNNVGVTKIDLLPHNYTDCSAGLCALRSSVPYSQNLQVNFTFEDGNLFFVELAGIPTTKEILDTNWFGVIKVKTVNSVASCDLYYDTEGGYLHKIINFDNGDLFSEMEIQPYYN